MGSKKITMQHIADALGLSRNTVSKALNGHQEIPESTRNKVLQKAAQLKYKQYQHLKVPSPQDSPKPQNIALLTRGDINTISFYSETISGIEQKLSSEGCNFVLTLVKPADIEAQALPPNINGGNLDGIICAEIFDKAYIEVVLQTGIPAVFIDTIPDTVFAGHHYNVVLMENVNGTYTLTQELLRNGRREIGFVGDIYHCRSFFERWAGYDRALREAGFTGSNACSITSGDNNPYLNIEWMKQQLALIEKLPSAFVCANDDIAITVIRSLKEMGCRIPDDIEVTGFDDIPNAEIIDPPLTTVRTYRHELGERAAESVLARIARPGRRNETVYLETDIVYRGSARPFSKF